MKYLNCLWMALLLFGCSHTLTEQQKIQITKEIEAAVDNFMNPKTLNYNTHVALRADKEGYLFASDGQILAADYKTYQDMTQNAFENVVRFTEMKLLKKYTYVLSEDAAVCTMEFKSKFLTNGGDTLNNNGCWTMVFKKFDNEWKVIQENGTHTK